MSQNLENDGRAREHFQDTKMEAGKWSVFMHGLLTLAVLLVFYIATQIGGSVFVDNSDYINESVYLFSIFLNMSLCAFLFYTFSVYRKKRIVDPEHPVIYRLMTFSTIALLFAALTQIHLVGSQNSLHHLLIIAILVVVFWFFRWREVFLFYFLGNAGLAFLIYLETTGFLKYAPLFVDRQELSRIFLDWRAIFGQSINYLLVLVVAMVLTWKLRAFLESSERLRVEANEALRREIEVRKKSEAEKEELIAKLEISLEDIKTLRGLLPICMHCKKIRDDKGYWQKLENYFKEHSPELTFSHGLCPDCAKEYYGDELTEDNIVEP